MKMTQNNVENFAMLCFLKEKDNIIVRNNRLLLYLSYCSDYPEIDSIDIFKIQDKKIIVFVDNNPGLNYKDNLRLSDPERIDNAYDYFRNKWFVSQPSFNVDNIKDRLYVNGYNVRVVDQDYVELTDSGDFNSNNVDNYTRLVIFRPKNTYNRPQNIHQFENALINNKIVGDVQPWINDEDQQPEGIIWFDSKNKNHMNLYTNIGIQYKDKFGFSYDSFSENIEDDEIKKLSLNSDLNNDWFDSLVIIEDDSYYQGLAFIPTDVWNKYKNLSYKFELEDSYDDLEERKKLQLSDKEYLSEDSEQFGFIEIFKNEVEKSNLHYDFKDLINFHTSMESSGMVILSGLSGTGKSKLVSAYASTLGLYNNNDNRNVCFIPVRPFWNDDSDLLGYADTMNNIYRPGDNGLVETLIDAENNPSSLYIIVFDEMNLARVEHYFSQFLSVLEMPLDKRFIQLYNDSLEKNLYNSYKYHSKIQIKENVMFVGTVNTDESTFKFSDKVLDRSNVITLNVKPFYEEFNKYYVDTQNDTNETWTYDFYKSLTEETRNNKLTIDEKKLLWEIHINMNNCDKNLGLGWRTVNQIEDFIKCLPIIKDGISRPEAIDLQIVQKVLTKIRGSEDQLNDLIGSNDDNLDNTSDNHIEKIEDILNKYKHVSDFKKSKEIISQKAKELKIYGFTM